MRVWDINPGYVTRQSLLGEHREIHALVSIMENNKRGFAHHPETLRWKGHLGGLKMRHALVVSEMAVRGYRHCSPVMEEELRSWPDTFVDPPGAQFGILREKSRQRQAGRIPLPRTVRQLWLQHRYSVLARDPALHDELGRLLTQRGRLPTFEALAAQMVVLLRQRAPEPLMLNALQSMWSHECRRSSAPTQIGADPETLLERIRKLAVQRDTVLLLESTALSDLASWLGVSAVGQSGGLQI